MSIVELPDGTHEYQIERIILGDAHNSERPFDASLLLRAAADWLEQRSGLTPDKKQPFLVRDVVVSTYNGTITLYLANND